MPETAVIQPATKSAPPLRKLRSRTPSKIVIYILLVLCGVTTLVPFIWMVSTSFKSADDALAVPPSLLPDPFTVDSYGQLAETLPIIRLILNSLGIAFASTALQIITSAMAAYVFGRIEFRGRSALFVLYLTTMMIPMQVLVVPLYVEMRALNMNDTYAGLLLPTIASAFGVFMLRQAVSGIPRQLDEAALIDGAGHIRIFTRIILPLMRPSLATFGLLAFMSSWNAFLWPLVIIRSPEFRTLPVALADLHGQFTTDWSVVMAGSVLSVVPILIIYIFAQRHVVQGAAFTGLK